MKPTDISANMGLPLITCKAPPRPAWREDQFGLEFNPYQNQEVVFMNLDSEIQSKFWGWADIHQWDKEIGSVIVARKDRKNIHPQQVEAVARFC